MKSVYIENVAEAIGFLSFCQATARWCRDNEIPYVYKDKKTGFLAGSMPTSGITDD